MPRREAGIRVSVAHVAGWETTQNTVLGGRALWHAVCHAVELDTLNVLLQFALSGDLILRATAVVQVDALPVFGLAQSPRILVVVAAECRRTKRHRLAIVEAEPAMLLVPLMVLRRAVGKALSALLGWDPTGVFRTPTHEVRLGPALAIKIRLTRTSDPSRVGTHVIAPLADGSLQD